jgi:hypothetical protein
MKIQTGCRRYDPILIERFCDGEMDAETQAEIQMHVESCFACQKIMREHWMIGAMAKEALSQNLTHSERLRVKRRVMDRIRSEAGEGQGIRQYAALKKLLIPAAAVASLFFFSIIFYQPDERPAGPSATIESITGNISSVMIMETPEERETVLWYSENDEA